jgi:glycosyltransferase involved in cell wall biosynthesis
VEAMMRGRPVVASRVGGLPEIVTEGVTGRLVSPGDPSALADAVADILDDPQKANKMAEAGREEATRRFSVETYADRLREVFGQPG